MRRRLILAFAVVGALAAAAFAVGVWNARADPVVRRAQIGLGDWPAGAAPVRVLVMSDIHLGSFAMDETRLSRIVAQANALSPDLVLIAGDFINGYGAEDAMRVRDALARALAPLHAPFGVIAVAGNHDHGTSMAVVADALRRAHVTLLSNRAVARGPLAIGAVDDDYSRFDDLPATLAALRRVAGARIILSHSPDLAPRLPADASFMIAGHTHCGQVQLPVIGPPFVPLRTHRRYLCGLRRERGRTVLVTAGLGTSDAPIRWHAPPDLWLVTFGPTR
jgi:predicted MPP superfamily phosphohydrolase